MLPSVRAPRLGRPEGIAAMVAFLFSAAAYVKGQALLVDGSIKFTCPPRARGPAPPDE